MWGVARIRGRRSTPASSDVCDHRLAVDDETRRIEMGIVTTRSGGASRGLGRQQVGDPDRRTAAASEAWIANTTAIVRYESWIDACDSTSFSMQLTKCATSAANGWCETSSRSGSPSGTPSSRRPRDSDRSRTRGCSGSCRAAEQAHIERVRRVGVDDRRELADRAVLEAHRRDRDRVELEALVALGGQLNAETSTISPPR